MKVKRRKFKNMFGSKLLFFIHFVRWLLLFIILLTVTALNYEFWLLDIYVSYIPQIFIFIFTLFILIFTLYGRHIIRDGWTVCWASIGIKDAAMFGVASMMTLYIVVSSLLIINPDPVDAIKPNLTVGTYNMLYTNPEIFHAAYFFDSNDADIITLQETKPEFVEEAKAILEYKYSEITTCDCSAEDTEIAIISKFPLSNTTIIAQSQNGAILRTEVKIDDDTTIAVYAVHIPPPVSNVSFQLRDDFIDQLKTVLKTDSLDTVVMGDFNTTIFSPAMQQFVDDTSYKMNNSSETAWPKCSWFGYGDLTCARIDHIFVSNEFIQGERFRGSGFGSDHRPLAVQLLIN